MLALRIAAMSAGFGAFAERSATPISLVLQNHEPAAAQAMVAHLRELAAKQNR